MTDPSISVITICYNNPDDLMITSLSVDSQNTPPFEHYIIDGSNNNEIENIIGRKDMQKPYRKYLHEKDNGISDAFNKGIRLSQGEWIILLNAGDSFFNQSVIAEISESISKHPSCKWLHAKYQINRAGLDVIIGKPHDPQKVYRGMRSICHQTMVIHRSLHNQYGLYDTNLKFGMDYDYLLRIKDEPFYFITKPTICYDEKGISSSEYIKSLHQTSLIYKKHFGRSMLHSLWQIRLKILFYLLHSPVGKFLYRLKKMLKLENM